MRTLHAGDLTLEPQTGAHAEEMFAVLSDPRIYEFENAPPQSLEWLQQRFIRLESRRSPDGQDQWLNWVVRLPSGKLVGYVQATVHADRTAAIGYEFSSIYWGRGLARRALESMLRELVEQYQVRGLLATLKRDNWRSLHLLERLGFARDPDAVTDPSEVRMQRWAADQRTR